MRVRRCFSLLKYLLCSSLYDQKSKVCTARIKRCFWLLNYLLRSPLYDQKSKVCIARIKWCFSLPNCAPLSTTKSLRYVLRALNDASVAYLFPALPTLYDQESKVCTARIKRCFSLLSYLLRSPLYDQKSKVCTALIRRCVCLLSFILNSPLYGQKSEICSAASLKIGFLNSWIYANSSNLFFIYFYFIAWLY
jgi:hypothetical protein